MTWLAWALIWWGQAGQLGSAAVMSMFALLGGFALIAVATVAPRRLARDRADLFILVATLLLIGIWLITRSGAHGYQTDELTTGQASVAVLLSGHNPYATDLTPLLTQFNLPPQVWTPLFTGGTVHTTSYPALSFLLYAPLGLLAGTAGPFALITDGIAFLLLMVVVWRLLPAELRPIVPVIASSAFYVGFVDGGVTDVLFLPFLCVALHRWPRFVGTATGTARRWAGPIALGVACAVKPLPWLLVPFLVASIALEAHRAGRPVLRCAAQYVAAVIGVFALINVPFIVMDAGDWARDTLLPVTQALVPFGQGLVQFPLYLHIGGGRVGLLSVVADAALVASFATFVVIYPRSRRGLPLFALLPLVLSSRSLLNYFAAMALLALVSAADVSSDVGAESVLRRGVRFATGGVAAVAAGVAVVAIAVLLSSAAPIQLAVTGQNRQAQSSHPGALVISVRATNQSGAGVVPRFAVSSGGFLDSSWQVISGPARLLPGETATYRIESLNVNTFVDTGTSYFVDILSTDPTAVSASDWVTAP